MAWYREVEEPKGISIDPSTGQPADYFYGMSFFHTALMGKL